MTDTPLPEQVDRIDQRIATFMRKRGPLALRLSLAVIFIWFGLLKPLGLSPVAGLVKATAAWMPFLGPSQWLAVTGWWEVAIGVTMLHPATIRLAIGLLAVQMGGTFLPLILLPEVTFQAEHFPFAPTMEGQYIIKNLVIIAAALALGGTVRGPRRIA